MLYPLSFKAAVIDRIIWDFLAWFIGEYMESACSGNATATCMEESEPLYGYNAEDIIALVTLCCHFALYISVTSVGMISLQMVATRNACSHLLFPFQFFDLAFLYAFFSIRTATSAPTLSWVVQQVLLQINIVLRNSGYAHALVKLYISPMLVPLIGGEVAKGFTERDPYDSEL